MLLNRNDKFVLSMLPASATNLWLALYLHTNGLLRCYPKQTTLQIGLQKSDRSIRRALDLLEYHRALYRVPVEHRLKTVEGKLRNDRNVYQLTGVAVINNSWRPIVFMQREEAHTVWAHIKELDNDFMASEQYTQLVCATL